MPSTAPPIIRVLSHCTVKPHLDHLDGAAGNSSDVSERPAGGHPRRCELSLWDLSMLSTHYIQKGHLFSVLLDAVHLDRLKTSLSVALWHFYPLAGRFAAEADADGEGMYVHIDCNDRGAEFIHASADESLTVADVLAPSDDVPDFVRDFFPLDGVVNYDGVTLPLLAVQVTELADGVFLGCSFNHAVGDGTSFWNFFNAWAEIARSTEILGCGGAIISRPPVHDRWFVDAKFPIKLPFTQEGQFVERFTPPPLREKVFHFTARSVAGLKARANAEAGLTDRTISSFQALSALMWRCITRLRRFPEEQRTSCRLAAENRGRLRPPLPPDYFGNSIYPIPTTTTAGELLAHDLGWAAGLLNQCVASHTDAAIRGKVERWMASPVVYTLSGTFDRQSVMMGSSPRFDMYGCDFGWGRAVALRSGTAHKFDGKVSAYPGRDGGGSIDLEVCLPPEGMSALEAELLQPHSRRRRLPGLLLQPHSRRRQEPSTRSWPTASSSRTPAPPPSPPTVSHTHSRVPQEPPIVLVLSPAWSSCGSAGGGGPSSPFARGDCVDGVAEVARPLMASSPAIFSSTRTMARASARTPRRRPPPASQRGGPASRPPGPGCSA